LPTGQLVELSPKTQKPPRMYCRHLCKRFRCFCTGKTAKIAENEVILQHQQKHTKTKTKTIQKS